MGGCCHSPGATWAAQVGLRESQRQGWPRMMSRRGWSGVTGPGEDGQGPGLNYLVTVGLPMACSLPHEMGSPESR